jgi:7-cyano-7-deazaguanine tRNA-ribosyltransferase
MTDVQDVRSTFQVEKCDLMGRRGKFEVNGRKIRTPELMPVVNPNKLDHKGAVQPEELQERFKFNMIITNSYIINRGEELKERAMREGLHRMLSFEGIIMTDSGTFQSYMYGGGEKEVDVDPLEIIRFQKKLGSDVGTILDRFTVPDAIWSQARSDLDITLTRARDSLSISEGMEVAVPVQGGRHLDLRRTSGEMVRSLGAGYAPIGGVVPIMESYDYSLLVDVIANSKIGLGPSIPVHLFGAGHPMILPLAVALGCDLFDSASYVKFAQDDRYMTRDRTYHINEMEILPCSCPVCYSRDPRDLLSIPKREREHLTARHNLWVLRTVMDEIRSSIEEGTLWELIERSAMSNPKMYAAVRKMRDHRKILERESPRSARRFMCCSGLSLARPEFKRYEDTLKILNKQKIEKTILLDDWTSSHNRNVSEEFSRPPKGWKTMVNSPLGPVPYELIEMYPLGQSIFPPPDSLDRDLSDHMNDMMTGFDQGEVVTWNGKGTLDMEEERTSGILFDVEKVIGMTRVQFANDSEIDPAWCLFDEFGSTEDLLDRIVLRKSRRTGRIRNVLIRENGSLKHLFSIRAEDGMITLKLEGAEKLHSSIPFPFRRVQVDSETGEYNARGLNVFCKFVTDACPKLRAGDDAMVVDEEDRLLALGRVQASRGYLVDSRSGIAVKVKEGVLSKKDKDNN